MPPKGKATLPKKGSPLTYHQTVIEMLKFLEVSIHTILYVRRIYPAEVFAHRKKWDAPVYQSRHPDLNDYISRAVKAVGDELIRGSVERVVVVIRDRDNIAIERFIFSFSGFLQLDRDTEWQKWKSIENTMTENVLSQYFRSFLIRLNLLEGYLKAIPQDWDPTFAIVIEMKDDQVPADPITKPRTKDKPPKAWVPASLQNTTQGTTDEAENHVIRAVDTGILSLSLVVQESEEKLLRKASEEEEMAM